MAHGPHFVSELAADRLTYEQAVQALAGGNIYREPERSETTGESGSPSYSCSKGSGRSW